MDMFLVLAALLVLVVVVMNCVCQRKSKEGSLDKEEPKSARETDKNSDSGDRKYDTTGPPGRHAHNVAKKISHCDNKTTITDYAALDKDKTTPRQERKYASLDRAQSSPSLVISDQDDKSQVTDSESSDQHYNNRALDKQSKRQGVVLFGSNENSEMTTTDDGRKTTGITDSKSLSEHVHYENNDPNQDHRAKVLSSAVKRSQTPACIRKAIINKAEVAGKPRSDSSFSSVAEKTSAMITGETKSGITGTKSMKQEHQYENVVLACKNTKQEKTDGEKETGTMKVATQSKEREAEPVYENVPGICSKGNSKPK